jgi:enamine deaminase RidA (YjgF/YER057c/UK114 family)
MRIEARLRELELTLPAPLPLPEDLTQRPSFAWVRPRGAQVYVSAHGPQRPDGAVAGPFGRVGAEVSGEEAHEAARLTALAMLASLRRALGDLDRVTAWLAVTGMVYAAPGFTQLTHVVNGFSDLIITVYGEEAGLHARTVMGVAALPLSLPVMIAAVVEVGG